MRPSSALEECENTGEGIRADAVGRWREGDRAATALAINDAPLSQDVVGQGDRGAAEMQLRSERALRRQLLTYATELDRFRQRLR